MLNFTDKYHTSQPIALLKLFLEFGGMYSQADLNWKIFNDVCELKINIFVRTSKNQRFFNFQCCLQQWVLLAVEEMK